MQKTLCKLWCNKYSKVFAYLFLDVFFCIFFFVHFVQTTKENQFLVVNAQNDVCIKSFLEYGCIRINSVQNLRTK